MNNSHNTHHTVSLNGGCFPGRYGVPGRGSISDREGEGLVAQGLTGHSIGVLSEGGRGEAGNGHTSLTLCGYYRRQRCTVHVNVNYMHDNV